MANSQDILDALYLFSHTEEGRTLSVSQFITDVVNPITVGNGVFYKENGKPLGFTTWCWLNDHEVDKFKDGSLTISVEMYKRRIGDQMWGIWLLAPFGHFKQVWRQMKDRCHGAYGDTKVHWIRLRNTNSELTHKGRM